MNKALLLAGAAALFAAGPSSAQTLGDVQRLLDRNAPRPEERRDDRDAYQRGREDAERDRGRDERRREEYRDGDRRRGQFDDGDRRRAEEEERRRVEYDRGRGDPRRSIPQQAVVDPRRGVVVQRRGVVDPGPVVNSPHDHE